MPGERQRRPARRAVPEVEEAIRAGGGEILAIGTDRGGADPALLRGGPERPRRLVGVGPAGDAAPVIGAEEPPAVGMTRERLHPGLMVGQGGLLLGRQVPALHGAVEVAGKREPATGTDLEPEQLPVVAEELGLPGS